MFYPISSYLFYELHHSYVASSFRKSFQNKEMIDFLSASKKTFRLSSQVLLFIFLLDLYRKRGYVNLFCSITLL